MLYLASESPQRSTILRSLSVEFSTFTTNFDEKSLKISASSPTDHCIALAKAKLDYAIANFPGDLHPKDAIIAADTLIFLDKNRIYGKPQSVDEAKAMLRSYSGKSHYAVTAIAGYSAKTKKTAIAKSVSKVWFTHLSATDINFLIASNEWANAAGAYRIQGRSAFFIKKIAGSYSGILGFPIHEFYKLAQKLKISL